jgi:hypothetical protein
MWFRILRLGLLVGLLAVLHVTVAPQSTELHADGGTCSALGDSSVWTYGPSGEFLAGCGILTDMHSATDYAACTNDGLDAVTSCCVTACRNAGINTGDHGIAFCSAEWDAWWNGSFQAPHHYTDYDCGDI